MEQPFGSKFKSLASNGCCCCCCWSKELAADGVFEALEWAIPMRMLLEIKSKFKVIKTDNFPTCYYCYWLPRSPPAPSPAWPFWLSVASWKAPAATGSGHCGGGQWWWKCRWSPAGEGAASSRRWLRQLRGSIERRRRAVQLELCSPRPASPPLQQQHCCCPSQEVGEVELHLRWKARLRGRKVSRK
jgi:hypothetical protein